MVKTPVDKPAIYQKSANYYESTGTFGVRQVVKLHMTVDMIGS